MNDLVFYTYHDWYHSVESLKYEEIYCLHLRGYLWYALIRKSEMLELVG